MLYQGTFFFNLSASLNTNHDEGFFIKTWSDMKYTISEIFNFRARSVPKWTSIGLPFSWQVWVGLGITLVIMLVVMFLAILLMTKQRGLSALETATWFVIPAMLSQDVTASNAFRIFKSRVR